jgi:glycosyltransferase involved in cell wall biosynthesis
MKLTICIPVYNSEKTIKKLVHAIESELSAYDIQFVIVNDGSKDSSEKICIDLAKNNSRIKFISLRKNVGEHNAVMCALNYMTGDCAVIIDDDFQNPPNEILKLVSELENGYDVVYSYYGKKNHTVFRNLGSWFNNLVSTWLLSKPKNLYLSSFKVIRREIVDEIIKYKGPYPYVDGLILRVTDNISTVLVEHKPREEGRSNYTFIKLISLWLNMVINFSIKPLRLFTVSGMVVSSVSFLLIIYYLVNKMLHPEIQAGWTSLILTITFFSGIQLLFLGIVAEYLGKAYLTINQTPQWTVKKEIL